MKIVILYRQRSDHGRQIEDFMRDLKSRFYEAKIEAIDVDSREGMAMASIYDVVQYPAIMVTKDDGYLQQSWQGSELPLIDEVIAYARVGA